MPRRGVIRMYIAALLVLGLVTLESLTVFPRASVSRVSGAVNTVLLPLEVGTNSVTHFIASGIRSVVGAFGAERENQTLRVEVQRLQAEVTTLQATKGEDAQLRKLLQMKNSLPKTERSLTVPVVGRSPVNWLDQVVIAGGSHNGIKYGDPVLSYGGVVGRVISVGPVSSTVVLLPDPESAIGAMVARSSDAGVLLGNGQAATLTMQFFAAGANVRKGDLVVTSGLDHLLPAGLPLGRVISTSQGDFGLVKVASVRPLANLNELQDVLVILR
ncbi:MAG: rod shape-determining protein MreC [Thermaerobacter sp.]|nr:rod shape-determining protein MreC [Thermaerobacter sp.]